MKFLKLLLFIVFLFFGNVAVYAQKEMNYFALYKEFGFDFNAINTHPVSTATVPNHGDGVSTICDTSGNLLFYTNNNKVWNKNHQPMMNGFGLKGVVDAAGSIFSLDSCVILPTPNTPGKYFIVTIAVEDDLFNVYYSVVDMSLDN